jgi:hypothetical protein
MISQIIKRNELIHKKGIREIYLVKIIILHKGILLMQAWNEDISSQETISD